MMIELIIKMLYEKFNEDIKDIIPNSDIDVLNKQYSELLDKIAKLDKTLGKEMDALVGTMLIVHEELYFKAGFKDGIRIIQELQGKFRVGNNN